MCFINFGVFNIRELKNELHFKFKVPPSPVRWLGNGVSLNLKKKKSSFLNTLLLKTPELIKHMIFGSIGPNLPLGL